MTEGEARGRADYRRRRMEVGEGDAAPRHAFQVGGEYAALGAGKLVHVVRVDGPGGGGEGGDGQVAIAQVVGEDEEDVRRLLPRRRTGAAASRGRGVGVGVGGATTEQGCDLGHRAATTSRRSRRTMGAGPRDGPSCRRHHATERNERCLHMWVAGIPRRPLAALFDVSNLPQRRGHIRRTLVMVQLVEFVLRFWATRVQRIATHAADQQRSGEQNQQHCREM